ncbi:hypothetical protein ABPG74_013012 [Tetrahymena malaccensis]
MDTKNNKKNTENYKKYFNKLENFVSSSSSTPQNQSSITINLSYQRIQDQDASQLASILPNYHNLSTLRLELIDSQIGSSGSSELGQSMIKCANLSYIALLLSDNLLQNEGISQFMSSLMICSSLTALNLNFSKSSFDEYKFYKKLFKIKRLVQYSMWC